ncbi:ATP-binding protein, partial [Calditrichota bacterium]
LEEEEDAYQSTLRVLLKIFNSPVGSIWEYHNNNFIDQPSYLTLEGAGGQRASMYKTHCLEDGNGLVWQAIKNVSEVYQIKEKVSIDEVVNKEMIDQYNHNRKSLLVKLVSNNEIFGVACLGGMEDVDKELIDIAFQFIMKIASIQIQNRRNEKTKLQLEKIQNIIPNIGGTIRKSCNRLAVEIREILSVQAVSIFLKENLDSASEELFLYAADVDTRFERSEQLKRFEEDNVEIKFKQDTKSLFGSVSFQIKSNLNNNLDDSSKKNIVYREINDNSNKTWICVPLRDPSGNCIGIISCIGKIRTVEGKMYNYIFNKSDMFILSHIADIVTPILINLKTVTNLDNMYKKLEKAEQIREHETKAPLSAIMGNAGFVLNYLNESGATSKERRLKDIISDCQICAFLLTEVNIPSDEVFDRGVVYKSPEKLLVEVKRFLERQIKGRSDAKLKEEKLSNDYKLEIYPFMRIKISGYSSQTEMNQNLLKRAFYNLGINAVKYGKPNGLLEIKIAEDSENKNIIIDFCDNGVGVLKEDIQYIFSENYRGKNVKDHHTGQGFGLSIAKSIVERHRGSIFLKSRKDPTIFRIVIPIIKSTRSELDNIHPSAERIDQYKKVQNRKDK